MAHKAEDDALWVQGVHGWVVGCEAWQGVCILWLAFAVIDEVGDLVAAAFGVPPFWVDTIQGAELWAVQMTLAAVVFPSAIYTDCKTVQLG